MSEKEEIAPKVPNQERVANEPSVQEHQHESLLGDEKRRELEQKSVEQVEKKIEELKGEIEDADQENPWENLKENSDLRQEKIKKYQERYFPKHLRGKKDIISKALIGLVSMFGRVETEGRENIPKKGPYFVVCNHPGGGEPEALMGTFKNLHIAIGKKIWWDRSPWLQWFFKKIGGIPIEESLSNLSLKDKKEAMGLQKDKYAQAVFEEIIRMEEQGKLPINTEFVRAAVALLLKGDSVCVFPEGLWLNPEGSALAPREKQELKKAYSAMMELIVRQYKKLTGEELPIMPVAFIEDRTSGKKKLSIGEPLSLDENNTELSGIDYVMAHVAERLPEKQRGYYKDKIQSISKKTI
ncbi:MAG: hypothetical protein A3D44_00185 [Candidatus Staskawiczbacteria bacterium RIFCSPHIGHO2_02_FULL_42_22]|uniref:Phospholipid/glycerol acyltransferase domain-containing protein n=1 Tax=Candidatus Staskawiczbacteria bacterium RIFCSPHIGHO2_02_FULL_42_22 TaxID=1802207 RepID=A0A1G2I3I0_9BACT|nr:MAG: hypothetical protein A3D44_00185 [Candidatus Staskawiczbacteria bacterium RIFCSPHIGHO2_02_FULL_42_22]